MATNQPLAFSHIGLHVRSLEQALSFFVGQLQLEVESRGPVDDALVRTLIEEPIAPLEGARLRLPRIPASIQLTENRQAPSVDNRHPNPGTCHIAFFTHDLEDTWHSLAGKGCKLVSTGIIPIDTGVFGGGKAIYCVGPEGYRLEFMQGPAYLDGSRRDPDAIPNLQRANETCHIGIQVRDRDRSLAFYRDLLGIESLAEWLEADASTKAVIGLPEAELNMAILRLPGTHACLEVIEYRNTSREPVDTRNRNNGTFHLAFCVPDLHATLQRLTTFGSRLLAPGILSLPDGRRTLCCEDPDGIRVQFIEMARPA